MSSWRFTAVLLLAMNWPAMICAATLSFQFSLDEDTTTSAGVYKTDGTLVRTLWRKVQYPQGQHTDSWDGLNDEKKPEAVDSYVIRVLMHQVEYVWQGAIGNTSSAMFGPTVHRGFNALRDLTFTGNNAFYITGYVEGDFDFRHFLTNDPQSVNDRWCWYLDREKDQVFSQAGNIYSPDWIATDTDGTWVYFASPDSTDPQSRKVHDGPGFIVASDVETHMSRNFKTGKPIENGPEGFAPFANGIKVGSKTGLSGMAVQKNGNLLAVSVRPEDRIYFFHKRTGAKLGSVKVASPGALSFHSDGTLFALSGNALCKITAPNTNADVSIIVSDLETPLDLNVSSDVVAVVDGGGSQQVKAYDVSDGHPAWVLGKAGGYLKNGPEVTNEKFHFIDREGNPRGCIAFEADGSFWLSDPGNRRLLHFKADLTYQEEIAFQNVSYSTSVDANNPARVFSDFLEFSVDYSQPLSQSWKLVRNWAGALSKPYFDFGCGLRQVTTLTNGRTYGVIQKRGVEGGEIVELSAQGIQWTNGRLTRKEGNPGHFETLIGNGSIRRGTLFDNSSSGNQKQRASFEEKPLLGFDSKSNPFWGRYEELASAPAAKNDPVTRCCSMGDSLMPMTSSDIILSFDPTKNNGWHLGGVRRGGSDWLWKASPSVRKNVPLDGLGSFGIGDGVNYPGNVVLASGRNAFFGYHGEFWNDSQACQFMHFYDNGLFVGQFGEPSTGHERFEGVVPGLAGNSFSPCVTEVNGKIYLWTNDESQHGPQRWFIDGAQTIREAWATGTLGQTETLVVPPPGSSFPTGVKAKTVGGNVLLTWNPVSNAESYNVRKASFRGGPAVIVKSGIANNEQVVSGLPHGISAYFTITAVSKEGESVFSKEIKVVPISDDIVVEKVGRYDQPGSEPSVLAINSTAARDGKPALLNLNPLLGNLARRNVGSAGYRIFHWSENEFTDSQYLPGERTISPGDGWRNDGFLGYRFRVDGVLGSDRGLYVKDPSQPGIIEIDPKDDEAKYLTVIMPARFRDAASYKVELTSKNPPNVAVKYETSDPVGIHHIYQFRFRGPVMLSVRSVKGPAAVQAIFLDPAE